MRRIEETKTIIARIAADQRGATAIEYALIAGLISLAAITAMSSMGSTLSDTFSSTNQIFLDAA